MKKYLVLNAGQFDQQITHDHSIMGTANDKFYDATHDNLDGDTHQVIHQVSHQDSTPSAAILHLIPHFQFIKSDKDSLIFANTLLRVKSKYPNLFE